MHPVILCIDTNQQSLRFILIKKISTGKTISAVSCGQFDPEIIRPQQQESIIS